MTPFRRELRPGRVKYTDMTAEAMKPRRPGMLATAMPVGGIFTPVLICHTSEEEETL